MSAPTSPSSPKLKQNSGDPFDVNGAEDLWRSWSDGLTPDPLLSISQWG